LDQSRLSQVGTKSTRLVASSSSRGIWREIAISLKTPA
jgi:hypothetical protein